MFELKIHFKNQFVSSCPAIFIPRIGEKFVVKTETEDGDIDVINGRVYSIEYINYLSTKQFIYNVYLH